jgi:hypothetical protein
VSVSPSSPPPPTHESSSSPHPTATPSSPAVVSPVLPPSNPTPNPPPRILDSPLFPLCPVPLALTMALASVSAISSKTLHPAPQPTPAMLLHPPPLALLLNPPPPALPLNLPPSTPILKPTPAGAHPYSFAASDSNQMRIHQSTIGNKQLCL